MKQYCIYLRKSRADMDEERRGLGETLSRHREMLLDLADRMGIVIPESAIYKEIVSGDTIAERPEMQRLLHDVERGTWAGVLVADVDRLARGDTMDQGLVAQTFLYSHTLIISPYKTYNPDDPSDREFFEMKLFFARREYDQIKRRLYAGRVNAAREGLYVGGREPYGYTRVKLKRQRGWSLEVVPEQAEIVRMIFDWYINGIDGKRAGGRLIAKKLNELGVQAPFGRVWETASVMNILNNPVYCGKIQWAKHKQTIEMRNGKRIKHIVKADPLIAEGKHEPIITQEMFDEANKIRSGKKKSPNPSGFACAFIFAGLIKCAHCGRAVVLVRGSRPEKNWVGCSSVQCFNKGAFVVDLERAVLDVLRQWTIDFDPEATSEPQKPKTDASKAIIKTAEKQITTLKNQLSRLRDLLEQGVYTPDVYLDRQADINNRIEEQQRVIEAAKVKPSTAEVLRGEVPRIKSVLDAYKFAETPGQKNALLRQVIGRIEYKKTGERAPDKELSEYMEITVQPVMPTK